MALARNTYRFALLFTGYGIASGLDDLGAYYATLPALLGPGLGGLALLCGTVAHYAGGSRERDGGDRPGGDDGTGVDCGDAGGDGDDAAAPRASQHSHEWY